MSSPSLILLMASLGLAFFFVYYLYKTREYDLKKQAITNAFPKRNKARLILEGILLLGIILSIYVVAKSSLDATQYCEIKPINETVVASVTTIEYDLVCETNSTGTAENYFERIIGILFMLGFYIIIYFVYSYKHYREMMKK